MIGTDELTVEALARRTVDDVAIDLTVAIHYPTLSREVFVLGMNMEGVGLLLCGPQFAAQVFIIRPQSQLVGVRGVVAEAVVNIVVRDTGTCAEGYLPSEVGKEVQSVVMMMLRDGQFAVQHEPVDEVRQLAHAAANALRGLTLGDGQPFLVSPTLGGAPDELPYGERLTRTFQQSVDVLHRQSEVCRLVLLQLHVHIAQSPADVPFSFISASS